MALGDRPDLGRGGHTRLLDLAVATGRVPEIESGRIEIRFCIVAEVVTGLVLITGGLAVAVDGDAPSTVVLSSIGLGLLSSTLIVSPGYYVDRHNKPAVVMFAAIWLLTIPVIALRFPCLTYRPVLELRLFRAERRIQASNGVSIGGVSQRKEIHMKRMTLLTSLIMVFSLITATAAMAGTGAKAGEGSQNADTVMTQTQENNSVQVQEPACQAGDPDSDCEAAQTRTQAREEIQVREHDGDCLGTDKECEADQERAQDRDRDQVRSNDGECVGTDTTCEQLRETNRAEIQERVMRRLSVLADGSGDGEYLRVLVRWMYTHMYGPISVLFA